MATEAIKSTTVTNADAVPQVFNASQDSGQTLKIKTETVAVTSGVTAGSTYRFFRVNSSDSIKSLQVVCTAIATLAGDIGLYTINGGAVVDADLYADGISLATAAPAVAPTADGGSPIECRFGDASTAVPGDINNQVWQDLGLASDPGLQYDVAFTSTATAGTAGTITLIMQYTSAGA